MAKLHVYLNFNGSTEEALNFYKNALGGVIRVQYYKDMPGSEQFDEETLKKVLHGTLTSEDILIMASDSAEGCGPPLKEGNNFTLSLLTNDLEESKRLFADLSEGGTIIMPLEKAFWGAVYGSFTDKFGINWMVNCEETNI